MPDVNDKNDERYFKDLELVLKAAQDDYKQVTYDAKNYQQGLIRNYAWIATVLFGVQCMLLGSATSFTGLLEFSADALFVRVIIFSILLSVGCFCLSVDTMRGRGIVQFPYLNMTYNMMELMAWQQKEKIVPEGSAEPLESDNLHRCMIELLQASINENRILIAKIGKKLRILSASLLCSAVFTCIAVLHVVIKAMGN